MDKTAEAIILTQPAPNPAARWLKPQILDLVWLLLFGALLYFSRNTAERQLLVVLAIIQVASPRVAWFSTRAGIIVSIGIQLFLGWLLIGVTDAVESSYFLILLLPVVSAATTFGWLGTLLVTVLAAGSYLSFLLFLDWNRYVIPPEAAREMAIRVLFLPLVGFLTYQLAQANRAETQRYQATARDLETANSNLREAEAHIRRADRLAALGQLTAGLAHELRNPLGTIKSSAELLARRLKKDDPVSQELAGFVSSEVDRTNLLITRFLEFARPFKLKLEPANVTQIIDRAIAKLELRNPPYPVSVIRNYSPDVRPVPVDADLMEQVMLNLLSNAAEASPAGGVVTVKTRTVDGAAEIAVIDRGAGIASKDRESIFNPFFTTKPDGVGLGLAIVSKIVDEHGGRILVDSAPGAGSVFRVWLPNAS